MLGWHILVYPRPETVEWITSEISTTPALDKADLVAAWGAHMGGLAWIDQLVEQGRAELLHLNGGYPIVYLVKSLDDFTTEDGFFILEDPPFRRTGPMVGDDRSSATGEYFVIAWDES